MKKPIAKVVGEDSNVFVTLGICIRALKKEGMKKEAIQMKDKVFRATSYGNALNIMNEYCELE